MRSLIILALISFAACQLVVQNPLELAVKSFTNKLGLTETQSADANNCLNTLFNELIGGVGLYAQFQQTKDIQALLTGAVQLYTEAGATVEEGCRSIAGDLATYASVYGNGQSVKANLETAAPYVLQKAATIFENVETGDLEAAGETLAVIFKLVIGNDEDVESVQDIAAQVEADHQDFVSTVTSEDEAIQQFLQALFDGLNLGQEANVDAVIALKNDVVEFVASLYLIQTQVETEDLTADVADAEKLVNNAMELLNKNQEGLQTLALLAQPVIQAVEEQENVLNYAVKVLLNTAINGPEFEKLDVEVQIDANLGDFAGAGAALAKEYLLLVDN